MKNILAHGHDSIRGLTTTDGGALNYEENVVYREEAVTPSHTSYGVCSLTLSADTSSIWQVLPSYLVVYQEA